MQWTPRERVIRTLRGEPVDITPFTIYENKLPRCTVERLLRNRGLCVVDRTVDVLTTHRPDVQAVTTVSTVGGKTYRRTDYQTPLGELCTIHEDRGFTSWCQKHLFSGPEDYKRLIFFVDNERYEPNYAAYLKAQERVGEDVFLRGSVGLEPMQTVIRWMGTERFCLEWMDNRDEVLRLYDALARAARRRYRLLAESPALAFNYGGNVTVEIIGPKGFADYYVPHYNEAAAELHQTGKLIGTHLDDDCRLIADLVRQTELDYVEAFTPAPDTDMTLADALSAWPDKALWINFPSSVHLASRQEIARTTHELLDTARGHPRFLLGITEDMPEDRWQENLETIMAAIEAYHGMRPG
jgi:hypothetical protein